MAHTNIPTIMYDWVVGHNTDQYIRNIRPVGNVRTITNRNGDMYGVRVQPVVGEIIAYGCRTTVYNDIPVAGEGFLGFTQKPWNTRGY